MKVLTALVFVCFFISFLTSCKSDAGGPAPVCDTICVKDSMKFVDNNSKLNPYVYISASNCNADTISWSYTDMGVVRQANINDLAGKPVKLNPAAVSCFIKDTSYAWLSFNDCATGRGYLVRIPYSSYVSVNAISSAMNPFDPKFKVAAGLAVYSDRGNLFAEDMATGKKALMTFGQRVEIDYDHMHESVDSVNVTPTSMWAKVKINNEWKVFQKDITLK
ncbi:MAG: hypothetical protein ABWZ25_01745 [Chitinophagaceae bacterium]